MDLLAHLVADAARFAETMAAVDPETPVPSCPDWTATDLVWHLAEVQWFWGSVVDDRLSDPQAAENGKPPRPPSLVETLDLFSRASDRLQRALSATAVETPVWTWHDTDHTVGFVLRRQAHEALVHRVDAELTAGVESSLDAEMAADGIDEILKVMVGGVPFWANFGPDGASMRIHASDVGRNWGLAFGRMQGTSPVSGTTYDLEAVTVGLDAVDAQAAVDGSAQALDLWLWGRGPLTSLGVTGDSSLADRFRRLAAEGTQ